MDELAGRVWGDPESPAVCLLALAIDRHWETDGQGRLLCMNWLPQTWHQEIVQDTGSEPHPRCLDRLGAALALCNNPDEYYHSVPGFRDICSGLASDWFDSRVDQHLTTDELLRGLVEAHMIHPPHETEKFSPQVVRYVNMVARHDGFSKLPEPIKSFGIPADPGVDWGSDLSGDEELFDLAAGAEEDRQQDLMDSLSSFLLDLADRLARLPLKHIKNAKSVADDILKRVPRIPAE